MSSEGSLTDSKAKSTQATNAGATSDKEGRPLAIMAKVICPANETESTMDCARNVHSDTRDNPAGVRLRST
jgi:hypothetical protein